MKKCFPVLLLFIAGNYYCQTVSPQVINSAGISYSVNVGGVYIEDNVGEPFSDQLNGANVIITQGFLQPLTTAVASVSILHNDVSCADKKDGNISISISNLLPGSSVQYLWLPASVCPAGNCSAIDSLVAGNYSVQILVSYSVGAGFKTDTLKPAPIVVKDVNGPCRIKVYTAITLNGDNINDVLEIDNITDFPNNKVAIYTRWGQRIFEINGYDNLTRSWPQKDDISKLLASTYFYVITLGDGTNSIKGWVELIKN